MTPSQFETCKTETISLNAGTAFFYSSVSVAKDNRWRHIVAKLNLYWSGKHRVVSPSACLITKCLFFEIFGPFCWRNLRPMSCAIWKIVQKGWIRNIERQQLLVKIWISDNKMLQNGTTQCYQTFHKICVQIWIDFLYCNDVVTGIRWSREIGARNILARTIFSSFSKCRTPERHVGDHSLTEYSV